MQPAWVPVVLIRSLPSQGETRFIFTLRLENRLVMYRYLSIWNTWPQIEQTSYTKTYCACTSTLFEQGVSYSDCTVGKSQLWELYIRRHTHAFADPNWTLLPSLHKLAYERFKGTMSSIRSINFSKSFKNYWIQRNQSNGGSVNDVLRRFHWRQIKGY